LTGKVGTVSLGLASVGCASACSPMEERKFGRVAQSVEQGTENPCVGGSIPSPATFSLLALLCFGVVSGCGDRCESLCRDVASDLDRCKGDALAWTDLGARSKSEFVEECRVQWEQERAELSPSNLVLSLEACQTTQRELESLSCDELMVLYGSEL
jgi:hypothetical protein